MQHPLPKKVGCTHACVTAILAMNSPANLQGKITYNKFRKFNFI